MFDTPLSSLCMWRNISLKKTCQIFMQISSMRMKPLLPVLSYNIIIFCFLFQVRLIKNGKTFCQLNCSDCCEKEIHKKLTTVCQVLILVSNFFFWGLLNLIISFIFALLRHSHDFIHLYVINITFLIFSVWCPLKGHTYWNKPAAFSLFKYVWPFSGHQVLKG